MSFEPRTPAQFRNNAQPELFTEGRLLKEMRAFANNNPRFRNGDIDRVSVGISEVTLFQVPEILSDEARKAYEQSSAKMPDAESEVELNYRFMAERADMDGRSVTAFMLAAEASHTHLELPVYVVRQISDGDKMPADYGPVSLTKTLEFSIATFNPYLHACESFLYTDDGFEDLYGGCSCENEINHEPLYALQQDDEGAVISESPVQIVSNAVINRLGHEAVSAETPEKALEFWATTSGFDLSVEDHLYDENLRLAFGTLRGLKQAIRQQAGVLR
jgi:hypothetical protein